MSVERAPKPATFLMQFREISAELQGQNTVRFDVVFGPLYNDVELMEGLNKLAKSLPVGSEMSLWDPTTHAVYQVKSEQQVKD